VTSHGTHSLGYRIARGLFAVVAGFFAVIDAVFFAFFWFIVAPLAAVYYLCLLLEGF
jgi:hypothetical protein